MKKIFIKMLAVCLCLLLPAGVLGASVYALSIGEILGLTDDATPTDAFEQDNTENEPEQISKDETVYVIANADGSAKKIIVSDWIKNTLSKASITDNTELDNVENVKGDESYTVNSGNMKVWDAQGNDIYYQGNIEKELPVDLSVTYTLNGNTMSPQDMLGKSGKVTIRFDYKNNQYENVVINNETKRVYVPFVMLTGLLLDGDNFTDIEVSNGKLVNDGSRTAVIGIAFPGLQSDLDIDKEKLDIPDYVEISANVKSFSMGTTMTLATNEVFNKIDVDKVSSEKIKDTLAKITDVMKQLTDGSSKLYDGICTLLNKSDDLISGVKKLTSGAGELNTGVSSLNSGVAELYSGTQELSAGLDQLAANNKDLNNGAETVFNSLLSVANDQLAASGLKVKKLTIGNYSKVLNEVMESIDEKSVYKLAVATAEKKVTATVRANESTVKAKVTETVKAQVSQKVESTVKSKVETAVLATINMTPESYKTAVKAGLVDSATQAKVNAAIENKMASDDIKAQIQEQTAEQMKTAAIQKTISTKTEEQIQKLIKENMNSAEVQNQITAALKKAKSGAASISALKAQLDSYNTFYTGLLKYTDGVGSAAEGADKLNDGAAQLKGGTAKLLDGSNELYSGLKQLQSGTDALTNGVNQLKDGAMQLSDGLKEIDEKGVQMLVDAVDGDLDTLLAKIRATVDVSKNYKSFAGISDDMDGQVKFIYRTLEVED